MHCQLQCYILLVLFLHSSPRTARVMSLSVWSLCWFKFLFLFPRSHVSVMSVMLWFPFSNTSWIDIFFTYLVYFIKPFALKKNILALKVRKKRYSTKGCGGLYFFQLWNVNWFINKVINAISRVIYGLLFSLFDATSRRH